MRLLLSIVLLVCSFQTAEATRPPYAFVTAGQSNMWLMVPNITTAFQGHYGPDTLIISCAVGGTSLAEWQQGEPLFEDCASQTRQAVKDGYQVVGFLWYQGEDDSHDYESASTWETRFVQMIYDFRNDTGTFPKIVFAQLGYRPVAPEWENWHVVQAQQLQTYYDHPGYRLVMTRDVQPYCPVEGPHYCPDGYEIIASRFLYEFLR